MLSMCATCRHADWDKTLSGRRHPRGSGKCAYQLPDSPLPKWAVEVSYGPKPDHLTRLSQILDRKLHGRWIYWREAHGAEPTPCATWEAK